jgi:NAD(P)H-hydrate epimerase
VHTVVCGAQDRIGGDAKTNLDILSRMRGPTLSFDPKRLAEAPADVVVDALFGTGLTGAPRAPYAALIEQLNQTACPIVAVDIPSGLDCNSGKPWGPCVRAEQTVTFVCLKQGFLQEASRAYCGQVQVASIGIEPAQWPARLRADV